MSTIPSHTRPTVHGLSLTPLTQCAHYSTPLDIIAVKHKCCRRFYGCIECHNRLETHTPEIWGKEERDEEAVLCGACEKVWTIVEYVRSGSVCGGVDGNEGETNGCGAKWNPKCEGHWGFYFEV